MSVIDNEIEAFKISFPNAKNRLLLNLDKMKKEIDEIKQDLEDARKNNSSFEIKELSKILKRSLYEYEMANVSLSIIREPDKDDILYRRRQEETFAKQIGNLCSDEDMLCFHGVRSIASVKYIFESGVLSSSVDRLGAQTSYDPPGIISATNKDTVATSVEEFMNLTNDFNYPASCLFVVRAKNAEEYNNLPSAWQIRNVDFSAEPERLVAVVTTPENISRVRDWANDAGVDTGKIMDFDAFIKTRKEMQNTSNLIRLNKQRGK